MITNVSNVYVCKLSIVYIVILCVNLCKRIILLIIN